MGALSDDGANAALDNMLGDGHGTGWPATVYLALSTTDPATDLTEPTGGSYTREAVANTTSNWPDASGRQKANAVSVTFATATANWGVISHFAILSATTGGVLLAYDALTTSQSVLNGDTVVIPVGGVVLST